MKWTILLALIFSTPAPAHRLDEYLQATLISVAQDRVDLEINLTPGVAVLPVILAVIDLDQDGRISAGEETAYANLVLRDVALEVDGESRSLAVVERRFPPIEDMKEGLGTIVFKLRTELPMTHRGSHELRFLNHHQPGISAYLVNCLVPTGGGVAIANQVRDYQQTSIRFRYSFASDTTAFGAGFWFPAAALILFAGVWMVRRHG